MGKRECTSTQRLTQETLLALLRGDEPDSIQRIQINRKGGLPNGGSFKLEYDGKVTQSIRYEPRDNSLFTSNFIRRALALVGASTDVVVLNALNFEVKFVNNSGGIPQPNIKIKENNLTFNGEPVATLKVIPVIRGGRSNSQFSFLARIPLNEWAINSYDPKSRVACVTALRNGGFSELSFTVPELVPNLPGGVSSTRTNTGTTTEIRIIGSDF
jgi:hypothetical protein